MSDGLFDLEPTPLEVGDLVDVQVIWGWMQCEITQLVTDTDWPRVRVKPLEEPWCTPFDVDRARVRRA